MSPGDQPVDCRAMADRCSSPSLQPRKKQKKVADAVLSHKCCIEGMKEMPDASVRLIVADPPYGNVNGAKWDNAQTYIVFARAWLEQASRILAPGGTLLFFGSPCKIWTSRMNVMLEDELGLTHVQTLSWCYSQGGDSRLENMRNYAVRHEIVEWWTKKPGNATFNASLGAEKYSEEEKKAALAKGIGRVTEEALDRGRPPRTWVDIPRENSRSRERKYGKHTAMKPLALAERFINVHSNPGDVVLIPFAGSGTELLTASKLGREAIGFETEQEYIELMKKRFDGHSVALVVMEKEENEEENGQDAGEEAGEEEEEAE